MDTEWKEAMAYGMAMEVLTTFSATCMSKAILNFSELSAVCHLLVSLWKEILFLVQLRRTQLQKILSNGGCLNVGYLLLFSSAFRCLLKSLGKTDA